MSQVVVEETPSVEVLVGVSGEVEVQVTPPSATVVEIYTVAPTTSALSAAFQTAAGVTISSPAVFKEFFYTNELLTRVDVWQTPAKAVKIFTKVLTYSGDDLVKIETTNEVNLITLRKDLTYGPDGAIATITETFV